MSTNARLKAFTVEELEAELQSRAEYNRFDTLNGPYVTYDNDDNSWMLEFIGAKHRFVLVFGSKESYVIAVSMCNRRMACSININDGALSGIYKSIGEYLK